MLLSLIVAALREFGRGAGMDVGEEIGAVVDQGAQIELKALDKALGDLFFACQATGENIASYDTVVPGAVNESRWSTEGGRSRPRGFGMPFASRCVKAPNREDFVACSSPKKKDDISCIKEGNTKR